VDASPDHHGVVRFQVDRGRSDFQSRAGRSAGLGDGAATQNQRQAEAPRKPDHGSPSDPAIEILGATSVRIPVVGPMTLGQESVPVPPRMKALPTKMWGSSASSRHNDSGSVARNLLSTPKWITDFERSQASYAQGRTDVESLVP